VPVNVSQFFHCDILTTLQIRYRPTYFISKFGKLHKPLYTRHQGIVVESLFQNIPTLSTRSNLNGFSYYWKVCAAIVQFHAPGFKLLSGNWSELSSLLRCVCTRKKRCCRHRHIYETRRRLRQNAKWIRSETEQVRVLDEVALFVTFERRQIMRFCGLLMKICEIVR